MNWPHAASLMLRAKEWLRTMFLIPHVGDLLMQASHVPALLLPSRAPPVLAGQAALRPAQSPESPEGFLYGSGYGLRW
jgi:hypothetical protein